MVSSLQEKTANASPEHLAAAYIYARWPYGVGPFTSMHGGRVLVDIRPFDGSLSLNSILVGEQFRRQGLGTLTMKELMAVARMYGATIEGHVEPFGYGDIMSKRALRVWYEGLGFKFGKHGEFKFAPTVTSYPVAH